MKHALASREAVIAAQNVGTCQRKIATFQPHFQILLLEIGGNVFWNLIVSVILVTNTTDGRFNQPTVLLRGDLAPPVMASKWQHSSFDTTG